MSIFNIEAAEVRNFRIPKGDRRTVLFNLLRHGGRSPFNAAAATRIALLWENPDGVAQTPIDSQAQGTLADWSTGKVPIVLTVGDILSTSWNVPYALTVFYGASSPETYVTGRIEVFTIPGMPP